MRLIGLYLFFGRVKNVNNIRYLSVGKDMNRIFKIGKIGILIACLGRVSSSFAESSLTLDSALSAALQSNPEIHAQAAQADAEHSMIRAQYSLDNPRLGLMHENNMNLMEIQMGPMNTWSITQDIKFPTKYFILGSAQKSKSESADHLLSAKKLEIRKKVISAYYNLYAVNQVISLLEAQRETLREVARSAESRHATGAVPQQDEMKAHVEQSKIESDLLLVREEKETAIASLLALLNQSTSESPLVSEKKLPVPKVNVSFDEIPKIALTQSRQIKSALALTEEANSKKNLAGWNFVPDFAVSYKKAWTSAPPDNYAFGIELSIPLWFFAKQSGEYSSAASQAIQSEKMLESAKLQTTSDIRSLSSKVKSHEKLLQIYETALIPQASSTLNSSRTAYQAGRVNFLELLDSERSLYNMQIAYYRSLAQYIEFLTQLEELTGVSLSTLPFGGIG